MTDVLDKLHEHIAGGERHVLLAIEAADEIERLRAAIARAEDDFRKIARACELWDNDEIDGYEGMATTEYVIDQRNGNKE